MKNFDFHSHLTSYLARAGSFCVETRALPAGIVIFGASGDLAYRKLFPALYALCSRKLLPENFFVLGLARSDYTDDTFRVRIEKSLGQKSDNSYNFIKKFYYHSLDYSEPKDYILLQQRIKELSRIHNTGGSLLFYCATPPDLYECVAKGLKYSGLLDQPGQGDPFSRIIFEKPFGSDHESAKSLSSALSQVLEEDQIYRIDHYLGKDTVQNILMFRFANLIFEPLWNRNYIDHIQITASESLGIQTRAGYYDRAGQIRDMFQNHMLQLLSLVTMEPPAEYNADHIRNQKMRLLETLNFDTSSFVTGQYGPGPDQCAYTQEPGVSKNSKTPTFAAARLFIENWRWKGVPVYMRSGKAMKKKSTAISIVFKKTPLSIFRPGTAFEHPRNILIFRIQPDEGFDLFINGKIPGPKLCMSTLKMEFNYNDSVETRVLGDAYERLLLDAVLGDQTLFIRTDDLLMSWNKIEPLLQKAGSLDPVEYPAGSWGPKEADHIMESDHKDSERFWINI